MTIRVTFEDNGTANQKLMCGTSKDLLHWLYEFSRTHKLYKVEEVEE